MLTATAGCCCVAIRREATAMELIMAAAYGVYVFTDCAAAADVVVQCNASFGRRRGGLEIGNRQSEIHHHHNHTPVKIENSSCQRYNCLKLVSHEYVGPVRSRICHHSTCTYLYYNY